jgi:tight adherence protein B
VLGDAAGTQSLLPLLAFGSMFLLVYGLQQVLDRRTARLTLLLGRFAGRQVVAGQVSGDLLRRRRRKSSFRTLDRLLDRQGFAERMDRELSAAALPLRVGEYLLIRWGCALGLAAAAQTVLPVPLLAIPVGLAGYFAPAMFVRYRTRQRADQVNEQLVDGLALISGGLRAGYSFLQGVEAVVRELPPPISEELRVMLEDLRIGVPLEEALYSFAHRVPTEDVDMVVTAMLVQRTSGGNLAEVLDNIAHTIRERIRLRREVSTLTAQERMSSYIVGSLPFVAFGMLSLTNPRYLAILFNTPQGQLMLAGAIVLEVVGYLVIRKIIDIRL